MFKEYDEMKQDAIDDIRDTKIRESIEALDLDAKLDIVGNELFEVDGKLGGYLYGKIGHIFVPPISRGMTYYWLDEMGKEDYDEFLKLLDDYIYDFHQDKLN